MPHVASFLVEILVTFRAVGGDDVIRADEGVVVGGPGYDVCRVEDGVTTRSCERLVEL